MKILARKFDFRRTKSNNGYVVKLNRYIRRWYEAVGLAGQISWVEEHDYHEFYVKLVSGTMNWWKLNGYVYMLTYGGSHSYGDNHVAAIRLSRREIESLAKKSADRILNPIGRETRTSYTKRLADNELVGNKIVSIAAAS